MNNKEFNEDIIIIERLLRGVCTSIKRKGREILDDFQITPPQFDALLQLIKNGEMTIGELSNRMYLACSTITDLIDRMEKNDLVERIKDQKDRRVVRIKVLGKGHELISKVLDERREYLNCVLEDLDQSSIQSLISSLKILHERTEMGHDYFKE